MRLAIAALFVTSPALAQNAAPGTGGDPLRELMILPAFVNTELPVLAMHGGNPEDTVLLFDGFELPHAFHLSTTRSVLPPGSIETMEVLPSAFGVEYGRGSSVLALSSELGELGSFGEVTVVDATARAVVRRRGTSKYGLRYEVATLRTAWAHEIRDPRYSGPATAEVFTDLIARLQMRLSTPWSIAASYFYTYDFNRFVVSSAYDSSKWRASLAASPFSSLDPDRKQYGIDSRVEVVRLADDAAGLTNVEWRLGQQTNSSRYTFTETFWRHDIAGWSSIAANLSESLRATAGLRVDNFDGDVATQPRASIVGKATDRWSLALAAGAYRRPPDQPHEVEHDLNPERATHVATGARYRDSRGGIDAFAYYIDRSRLVIRDSQGELRNTGLGTSLGIDLHAERREGRWFGAISTALTRSKRFDYLRAAERPSEYEQPFRLDLIGAYYRKSLIVSARVQLASGLPYTPYDGAIYNSDADTWEPLYVPPLSARAPFHHQLDVRVDYRFRPTRRVTIDVFLDLHNAYRNRDPIAYRYSYDYSEHTAITALPVFPFAGLRAYL